MKQARKDAIKRGIGTGVSRGASVGMVLGGVGGAGGAGLYNASVRAASNPSYSRGANRPHMSPARHGLSGAVGGGIKGAVIGGAIGGTYRAIHPNQRNAKTGIRSGNPSQVKSKSRVGMKGY